MSCTLANPCRNVTRLLPGEVEVGLPGHGDVGEVLLEDKDVPAHLLDTRLADPLEVLGTVDQNTGDQMAQTW